MMIHLLSMKMTSAPYGCFLATVSVFMVTVPDVGTGKFARRPVMCDKLGDDPSFNTNAVIGKPWRIQHAWNSPGNRCHELKFRALNPMLISRVYQESASLLDRHPNWTAPQLLVTISGVPLDMLLLFADGTTGGGKFEGIRHITTRGIDVPRQPKRLRKFRLHMFSNGKYVMFANCDDEVAWLLGRGSQAPTKQELADFNTMIAVGNPGKPVCVKKSRNG